MNDMHPVQVICVTGGKGGIGKSNIAINLSLALAERGQQVMLLDAALGLSNIDTLLGLTPQKNLADVMQGHCELRDVIQQGPRGIRIAPAVSGSHKMTNLKYAQHAGIIQAFSDLKERLDVLIIDTPPGIGDSVISFVRAAREVLMVVCNEPTSLKNTYMLIKLLSNNWRVKRFHILANMTRTAQEGPDIFARLLHVTDLFLDVNLQYVGAVPYDECIRRAVRKQQAVYDAFPHSQSSTAFKSIANKIARWPLPINPRGHLEFFGERFLV